MTESEENTNEQGRTATEQAIIDEVAADRGEEWAEENAALIIAQAELVGEL